MTGLLMSVFPAVNYLNLYYRSIELCKSRALSENLDFDQAVGNRTMQIRFFLGHVTCKSERPRGVVNMVKMFL